MGYERARVPVPMGMSRAELFDSILVRLIGACDVETASSVLSLSREREGGRVLGKRQSRGFACEMTSDWLRGPRIQSHWPGCDGVGSIYL